MKPSFALWQTTVYLSLSACVSAPLGEPDAAAPAPDAVTAPPDAAKTPEVPDAADAADAPDAPDIGAFDPDDPVEPPDADEPWAEDAGVDAGFDEAYCWYVDDAGSYRCRG